MPRRLPKYCINLFGNVYILVGANTLGNAILLTFCFSFHQ